jgi:hypothetical protein
LALPAGSRGIPAMYEVNGRQYLVVNATSTTAAASGQGVGLADDSVSLERAYVAFALPGK